MPGDERGDVEGGLEYGHDTLDAVPQELHNELLFERARHVLAVVPASLRDLGTASDLRSRLASPPPALTSEP